MNYRMPGWFTEFRSHQEVLIDGIVEAFKDFPVVILEAPTGTGKTLIAEAVRQRLATESGQGSSYIARYLCTSRQLQRQFVNDFPYARLLEGRRNYPTMQADLYPTITADDCNKEKEWGKSQWECSWCRPTYRCPYEIAKDQAVRADLSVTNTAYWLREVNGPGYMELGNLTIVDECDELESALLGYVELRIPRWLRERCTDKLPRFKSKPESWDFWLRDQVGPALADEVAYLFANNTDPRIAKRYRAAKRLLAQILDVDLTSGRWILDHGKDSDDVTFKPVWVSGLAKGLVWDHHPKFLLMSATVVSADVMMRNLGLPWGKWYAIQAPSIIPAARRPIVIRPKVDMSYKAIRADPGSWTRMAEEILAICNEWPGVRILVHAVSYRLGKFLSEFLDSRAGRAVVSPQSSRERDTQLGRFKDIPDAVLVAPAFERGVDLKDDLCRVIIWAKVPFPDTSDPQVSARLYSGRTGAEWYAVETIRAIVQGAGRAVRGPQDWGITYILDSQITRLLNERRGLWPRWVLDAIDMTGGVAAVRGLRALGFGPLERSSPGVPAPALATTTTTSTTSPRSG